MFFLGHEVKKPEDYQGTEKQITYIPVYAERAPFHHSLASWNSQIRGGWLWRSSCTTSVRDLPVFLLVLGLWHANDHEYS